MDHGTAWMVKALRAGQPVQLFNNQVRNPVWRHTLSQVCLELGVNNYTGVLNVAGQQAMTRAEFGLKMLDWWGVQERDSLTIGPSGGEWPLDCRMDISRATAVLQTPLWGVDEVLKVRNHLPLRFVK
jgi:dTDP-4-dehydrorhamnose reductase